MTKCARCASSPWTAARSPTKVRNLLSCFANCAAVFVIVLPSQGDTVVAAPVPAQRARHGQQRPCLGRCADAFASHLATARRHHSPAPTNQASLTAWRCSAPAAPTSASTAAQLSTLVCTNVSFRAVMLWRFATCRYRSLIAVAAAALASQLRCGLGTCARVVDATAACVVVLAPVR